ncbi:hypothetical protein SSTU70S_07060 [Stutzerimonas stutzeri]
MIGLCLGLAGVVWAQLPTPAFTLAWNHTIEDRWEEDYRVTADGLLLGEARIKGSGAGMKRRKVPNCATAPGTTGARCRRCSHCASAAPEAGDYQLCFDGQCHALSEWLGPPRADQPALELELRGGAELSLRWIVKALPTRRSCTASSTSAASAACCRARRLRTRSHAGHRAGNRHAGTAIRMPPAAGRRRGSPVSRWNCGPGALAGFPPSSRVPSVPWKDSQALPWLLSCAPKPAP